jgi:hypothetical protein
MTVSRRPRAAAFPLRRLLPLCGLLAAAVGCGRSTPKTAQEEPPAPSSNRIEVPDVVRQNLGIRFASVERRRVASTLRVPGHFELLPEAHREYRAPMSGRVEVAARPLQRVMTGDVLYTVDSPEWRSLQRELGEIETELQIIAALMESLDLVVTVDSATAHLAGALGRPVWVALRAQPEWRWMEGRSDSPWYPTMRLFRQTTPLDWRNVFSAMALEIETLVVAKNGSG